MTLFTHDPTKDAASNPDTATGRAAHSPNGPPPTGGERPDADPISELATIDDTGHGGGADRPHLADQPGAKPGFGPDPNAEKLVGNPELGIDPRDAAGSWQNGPKAP